MTSAPANLSSAVTLCRLKKQRLKLSRFATHLTTLRPESRGGHRIEDRVSSATRWSPCCRYSCAVIFTNMSAFTVNVIARNPKREEIITQPVPGLVDTGSELTWLPGDVLRAASITPWRKRIFSAATKQKVEREVGYAILSPGSQH
jgi:hypothetical protein